MYYIINNQNKVVGIVADRHSVQIQRGYSLKSMDPSEIAITNPDGSRDNDSFNYVCDLLGSAAALRREARGQALKVIGHITKK